MEDDFIQYFDIKIHWTKDTDGCGNTMVDDFIDATQAISEDKKFKEGVSAYHKISEDAFVEARND